VGAAEAALGLVPVVESAQAVAVSERAAVASVRAQAAEQA